MVYCWKFRGWACSVPWPLRAGSSLVGNMAARAAAGQDLSSRIVPKSQVAPGLVQAVPELAPQLGLLVQDAQLFGTAMSDSVPDWLLHDGMGASSRDRMGCPSWCNQRNWVKGTIFLAGTVIGIRDYAYDWKSPGGTTTLTVDSDGKPSTASSA